MAHAPTSSASNLDRQQRLLWDQASPTVAAGLASLLDHPDQGVITPTAQPAHTTFKSNRKAENRLNDLPWKDWLLFQKSFFPLTNDETLYGELIQFFTKRSTPDGHTSRVLFVTMSKARPAVAAHGRAVFHAPVAPADIGAWDAVDFDAAPFDFIMVDLRHSGPGLLHQALEQPEHMRQFLARCRAMLKDGGFCVLLAQEVPTDAGRYPLPWVLASLARHSFRLRDERIGLPAADDVAPTYVSILQAVPEIGPVHDELPILRVGAPAIRQEWVQPRPRPRHREELLHPAKFPEELVQLFISELAPPGTVVCDPMGGTGSTAVAALDAGHPAVLIELEPTWANIARARVSTAPGVIWERWAVLQGDARDLETLIPADFRPVGYTVTSPPYWRILHNPGHKEGQKARQAKGLPTVYSDSDADLGNVADYRQFIADLAAIYTRCADVMEPGRVLTIITKNVKFERVQYPIAWDLVFALCGDEGRFEYAGTTFWCQDNLNLKPFAMGYDWISNVLHHYCVHLRVKPSEENRWHGSRRPNSVSS